MPLSDHFRPPVWTKSSWEGFHGGWPAMMVLRMVEHLPADYTAEPRANLGAYFEFDVDGHDDDEPQPTFSISTDLTDQYEYEVLVYDQSRGRRLVAAVEIVSPANKDRPENRRAFVTKCAALLQQNVSVSIVDLVTTRKFNLYTELLALLDRSAPAFSPQPPSIYAVTCRCQKNGLRSKLDLWAYPLVVGQPLPTLPVWLSEDQNVSLDLDGSYEDTCRALRIP